MIKQLPSLSTAQEIPDDSGDFRQEALRKQLQEYLRGRWKIADARYFLVSEKPTWNAVEKLIGNTLHDQGRTKPVEIEWHRPGYDLVAIFEHGLIGRQTIAAAMLDEPIEGVWVVGYFALR